VPVGTFLQKPEAWLLQEPLFPLTKGEMSRSDKGDFFKWREITLSPIKKQGHKDPAHSIYFVTLAANTQRMTRRPLTVQRHFAVRLQSFSDHKASTDAAAYSWGMMKSSGRIVSLPSRTSQRATWALQTVNTLILPTRTSDSEA